MDNPPDAGWPLTAAQYGIWLGQQLDLTSPLYNVGECIEIRGTLDPAVFEAAVRQVVTEAETLHMRFLDEGNGPRQILDASSEWQMPVIDVSAAPDAWAAAEAWIRADLEKAVDLRRGPLFTEALFTAAPDRYFWYQGAHHIAMDGFGSSLLVRRVAEIYSALIEGKPCPGGAFGGLLKVVEEDLAYQASPAFERDRAFWLQRFADQPRPVSLTDRSSPVSRNVVRRTASLAPSSMETLQAAARRAGATWPDVFIAATAAYVHRVTGAHEVILGLPVMGRLGSVSLRIPSKVMNMVPLRVLVHPGASLSELARQVAQEVRVMRPHMRYRCEQLRRDLKRVGGDRRLFGPVVNIMAFDYNLRFAGQRGIASNVSAGPVEDLSIGVYARSDGDVPRIDFDANPGCYSADDLTTHQQRFLAFLDAVASAPDQAIACAQLELPGTSALPPGAAAQPRGEILDGGPLPVEQRDVVALIVERAREQPDAIALEHGGQRVSYGELELAARRIAGRLVALGASPDTLVAVLLPRSVDAITAILGVLFSGAGYLPLDPQGPGSRTAMILEDARPALLVTTSPHVEYVNGLGAGGAFGRAFGRGEDASAMRLVLLDDKTHADVLEAPVRVAHEHLAYVIYTSGSTGRPNGVMISRLSLAHFVAGATHGYGVRRVDRVLQFAPLHFDASVEEIFLTLCAGATLVLRTDEMLESVVRLLDACAEHRITVLDLPTAFWHELAYSVSIGAATLPPSVRTVIIGGEAALPERVARWRSVVGPAAHLLNTYGPTEATVVATAATLSGGDGGGDTDDGIPIGRPLPGVRAAIVDVNGRLVAPGDVGELHLMGAGLARGYLGRPQVDAARFIVLNQLPDRPRAYRTGDLVRQREDGQLLFVGRIDDELKISGHRIDPGEVETVLLGYPGVREAALVGQVLSSGIKRLSAYLVADHPAPTPAELRRHAQSVLPAASIPSAFVFTDRLPRTSSGKIDRAALREVQDVDSGGASLAPMTDLEQVVLRVWEQVLGASGLSAQDDFFERGGQSLQTIQVANRLGIELHREIPVAMVFRYPTIAGLAQALEQDKGVARVSEGLTSAMLADAELPHLIVPPSLASSGSRGSPPRQVLLTGATGFVGTHLLHELLNQTHARVVCLVRADDERQAIERIRRATADQRLPALSQGDFRDRVLAVPADLSRPCLGLGAEQFNHLAAECDVIYHNAAVVSLVRDYRSLRAVNVLGTREMLGFAAAVRPKPLHYVSTLAVAPEVSISPEVAEAFVPQHPGLRDGYKQSKWIAERLVQQAGERGLPVAVYRLGRVVGAPSTGVVNGQDLVWRLLRAGLPTGALPELDVTETWTPVDYVGRAIVRLSLALQASGTVYNLAPVPDVRLTEVFDWVRDYGYAVERCPVPAWRARLQGGADAADSATLAFFDLQSGAVAENQKLGLGHVRCDNLTRGLAGSGVECPPIDRAIMSRYLDYCVETGLLPRPPTHGRREA